MVATRAGREHTRFVARQPPARCPPSPPPPRAPCGGADPASQARAAFGCTAVRVRVRGLTAGAPLGGREN
eukprot:scaffold38661_cov61-Phaeocystis_antarctica.AAC.3